MTEVSEEKDSSETGFKTGFTQTGTIETPEQLKQYKGKLSDEQFAALLKAYRKAFLEHAGKGENGFRGLTTPRDSSPGGSSFASPLSIIQPRHKNRTTYVQRFKVLRERNKSLPKLDFNAKASGAPKKFQGPGSFSRSYTYDSMKLPSISTCSIVTGVSGKSVHSDGYRRRDLTDKRNLQGWKYNPPKQPKDQHSSSYTDLNTRQDYRDLTATMSKSLQNLAADDSSQKQENDNTKTGNSHKYESISYKKHLLKRQKTNDATTTDTNKRSKGAPVKPKLDKDAMKELVEKEFVLVKNNTRMSPLMLDKREKTQDTFKKNKNELFVLEQSGIYQIDLSNVRNEIPPVPPEPLPPVSAQTERSYRARKQIRSSKIKKKVIDQKWRDDCDCLRCDIIRRQFAEGDFKSYQNWELDGSVFNPSSPFIDDVTNRSDTATVTTTDDVTIHSAFTHTSYKSNSTYHQYPANLSVPMTNVTI